MSDLDPQQVASRATGHFQPCFLASRPVSRPVFASKLVRRSLHSRSLTGVLYIVWDRQGVLSWIPHLPCPGEDLGRAVPKRYFYLLKKSWEKDGETPSVTGCSGQGDSKKFESTRINLKDLDWSQGCPRDPGFLQPWIPGTRSGTSH